MQGRRPVKIAGWYCLRLFKFIGSCCRQARPEGLVAANRCHPARHVPCLLIRHLLTHEVRLV
eukprot:78376-Chlamydomonas_euryale.AAC.4